MTDTYDVHDDFAEAPAPPSKRVIRFDPTQERGEATFDRAHRHSRMVRWLKFVLPGLAAVGVLGFFAVMRLYPQEDPAAVIQTTGLSLESKSLVMEKPNISGFEGTRHAYEVKADRAVQDLTNRNLTTLDNIEASFGIADNVTAEVTAATGIIDTATKLLLLKGGITVSTSNGYRATFSDAEVSLDKGTLVSNSPLAIVSSDGRIEANSVSVRDRGARVLFDGGVKVTIEGDDAPAPAGIRPPPGTLPADASATRIGGNS